MPKSKIYIMGFATLLGFPVIGITLIGFIEENPWSFNFNWLSPENFFIQLLVGLGVGTLSGLIAWGMINHKSFIQIKMKYGVLIHSFKMNTWEIIFISFCAGLGEEFLFRGIIQPYWGVWFTAIFFVAIHGYLDPRDKKMMIYGIVMTIVIGILGYLKIHLGLIAPMAAHFAIDVVLLYKLTTDKAFKVIHTPLPSFQSPTTDDSDYQNDEEIN
jgi:membrane protease YdiL (CAAX protease family)